MKIFNVIGARPQFIKYFPIGNAIQEFNQANNLIENVLIHTGQHYDYELSKIFFEQLGIESPDYFLGIGSGSHAFQTGNMMIKLEELIDEHSPDVTIVYGDTNSTLACALAAGKMNTQIVHIEAGLRSYNRKMPEEINRVLTDHCSDYLFCPSKNAVENLKKEGFNNICQGGELVRRDSAILRSSSDPVVINVGDLMYDAIKLMQMGIHEHSEILDELSLVEEEYIVMTIHRAENTKVVAELHQIFNFILTYFANEKIIFPVHPRTGKLIEENPVSVPTNVVMINPIGYSDMIALMNSAKLVLTDSGGMQKEAFWLKTPCITLRKETEWVETIKLGWNVLYNNYEPGYQFEKRISNVYGDGHAAERIISTIASAV